MSSEKLAVILPSRDPVASNGADFDILGPVLPSSITLTNYRSFAGPVRLELRPITLLFGANNSGKSALLRALPLLSDSIQTAAGPLDLESPAVRGSSFQDLRWKGIQEDEDPDLGIELCWKGVEHAARVEYRLTWFEEWRRLIIRRLSVWDREGRVEWDAAWRPLPEERSSVRLTYEIRTPNDEPAAPDRLTFLGLSPESQVRSTLLEPLRSRLQDLQSSVQWLMAPRQLGNRIYPCPPSPRTLMRPDGSDAPSLLGGSPECLSEVSAWYEKTLRRRLRVQDVSPGRFRLMLQHVERAVFETDLAENGEGPIQVLPVLTALALTRSGQGPRILAIEQPESQLNPALQRALAEQVSDVAAASPDSRIVLETHSEHLLLGVQLQIMREKIRPEDVLIYWVRQLGNGESVADPVTLDENARLQGRWPPGVFSENTEVAREILQARRDREQAWSPAARVEPEELLKSRHAGP